jgi:hypothetical protein
VTALVANLPTKRAKAVPQPAAEPAPADEAEPAPTSEASDPIWTASQA